MTKPTKEILPEGKSLLPRRLRSAVRFTFTTFLCILLVSFLAIQIRYAVVSAGLAPTVQASGINADPLPVKMKSDGAMILDAPYCSEVIALNNPSNPAGRTSTQLEFNESWFFEDSRIYNHELATSCAILSAICNSESHFYSDMEGAAPYVEQSLTSLGFTDIRTDSYQMRSHALDQMGALFSGSHDVAAYAFARKTISSHDGSSDESLIFIGIRGSYGAEWLSNFKLPGGVDENLDHIGFKQAKTEIMDALVLYCEDLGIDPSQTKILITGHSRGGSIANLLAADFADRKTGNNIQMSPIEVYTYTFASPCTTRSTTRADARYENIFNIVNSSDIIPQLPLSIWDFGRYGLTVSLPPTASSDFEQKHSSMNTYYRTNTGYDNPFTPASLGKLDSFEDDAARSLPSFETLFSFEGVIYVAQTLMNLDVSTAMSAHFPDTYIAWLQSTEPSNLHFS